jgi:hypothetical protein
VDLFRRREGHALPGDAAALLWMKGEAGSPVPVVSLPAEDGLEEE